MVVGNYARKGYPGFNRLRAVLVQPLLSRLAYALKRPQKDVMAEWKVLSPRYFWPTVRMVAADEGITNVQAYILLSNTGIDLQAAGPHPLLCPRD